MTEAALGLNSDLNVPPFKRPKLEDGLALEQLALNGADSGSTGQITSQNITVNVNDGKAELKDAVRADNCQSPRLNVSGLRQNASSTSAPDSSLPQPDNELLQLISSFDQKDGNFEADSTRNSSNCPNRSEPKTASTTISNENMNPNVTFTHGNNNAPRKSSQSFVAQNIQLVTTFVSTDESTPGSLSSISSTKQLYHLPVPQQAPQFGYAVRGSVGVVTSNAPACSTVVLPNSSVTQGMPYIHSPCPTTVAFSAPTSLVSAQLCNDRHQPPVDSYAQRQSQLIPVGSSPSNQVSAGVHPVRYPGTAQIRATNISHQQATLPLNVVRPGSKEPTLQHSMGPQFSFSVMNHIPPNVNLTTVLDGAECKPVQLNIIRPGVPNNYQTPYPVLPNTHSNNVVRLEPQQKVLPGMGIHSEELPLSLPPNGLPTNTGQPPAGHMQSPPPHANGIGASAIPNNPTGAFQGESEKRKLIQQQLVLLLHAHKCQRRDGGTGTAAEGQCRLPHCKTMKDVLRHMMACTDGKNCKVAHCVSSRQIINHWRNCTRTECPVCEPLRRAHQDGKHKIAASAENMSIGAVGTNQPFLFSPIPNMGRPESNLSAVIPPQPPANAPDAVAIVGSPCPPDQSNAFQPKRWQLTVNKDQRNHMVRKIVEAIFPDPQPQAHNDARMRNLVEYARKVEKDTFNASETQDEYYRRLAEKIYRIQKELKEKRDQRQKEAAHGRLGPTANDRPTNTSNVVDETAVKVKVEEQPPATKQPSDIKPTTAVQRVKIEKSEPTPKVEKLPKKDFTTEELVDALLPVWEAMEQLEPEARPFRQPVDYVALRCLDYPDIIKHPMDLSTIRKKLEEGSYDDPWQFVSDCYLMFNNAWTYNKRSHKVYKWCTKLSETYEANVDTAMQKLGFCCGRQYVFDPPALCCNGQDVCTVPRDAIYFICDDKYVYCKKCWDEVKGDCVEFYDDPAQPKVKLPKSRFIQKKNDQLEPEKFVTCSDCERQWHEICAEFYDKIWKEGFTCKQCLQTKNITRRENKLFTAKKLQETELSKWLEKRVNDYLHQQQAGAGHVYIRILMSADKTVEVKPGMKRYMGRVEDDYFPDSFPYRAKAIFGFEEIDGVDVMFYGMHVQEYGSDCPAPNTRRCYISYLDSVHFFRPRKYRTDVYHQILIGYLDWCKKIGFRFAHIWACPPGEGDDYIFHAHPPEQRIPKSKRLVDWYRRMLDLAIQDHVVIDYKDILREANESNWASVSQIPYFEGDYWPMVLEDNIKELEEEDDRKRRETLDTFDDTDDDDDYELPTGLKRITQKTKKKKKKDSNQRKSQVFTRRANLPDDTSELFKRVYGMIVEHKDVFFTIKLNSNQRIRDSVPIQDPDPLVSGELMDGRDNLLGMARERHLEFSTLRRAKHSSMVLVYELHAQFNEGMIYTCNTCQNGIEAGYHCTVCEDFDLCASCYAQQSHEHKMEKRDILGSSDADNCTEQSIRNRQEEQRRSIQWCIESVVHACQCRDANCKLQRCHRMRNVVMHAKTCKPKANGGCSICKQLIALCCYHAKHCNEPKCSIPFCANMKLKLQQQQQHNRQQQHQLMRRRMALMRNVHSGSSSTQRPAHHHPQVQHHHQQQPPAQPHQQQQQFSTMSSQQQPQHHQVRTSHPSQSQQQVAGHQAVQPAVTTLVNQSHTGLVGKPAGFTTQLANPVEATVTQRNEVGWPTQHKQPSTGQIQPSTGIYLEAQPNARVTTKNQQEVPSAVCVNPKAQLVRIQNTMPQQQATVTAVTNASNLQARIQRMKSPDCPDEERRRIVAELTPILQRLQQQKRQQVASGNAPGMPVGTTVTRQRLVQAKDTKRVNLVQAAALPAAEAQSQIINPAKPNSGSSESYAAAGASGLNQQQYAVPAVAITANAPGAVYSRHSEPNLVGATQAPSASEQQSKNPPTMVFVSQSNCDLPSLSVAPTSTQQTAVTAGASSSTSETPMTPHDQISQFADRL